MGRAAGPTCRSSVAMAILGTVTADPSSRIIVRVSGVTFVSTPTVRRLGRGTVTPCASAPLVVVTVSTSLETTGPVIVCFSSRIRPGSSIVDAVLIRMRAPITASGCKAVLLGINTPSESFRAAAE